MHVNIFVPVGFVLLPVTVHKSFKVLLIFLKSVSWNIQPNIFLTCDRVKRTRVYSSRKAQIRLLSTCASLLTGLNLPPPTADKLHSPICNTNLWWAGKGVCVCVGGGGGGGLSGRPLISHVSTNPQLSEWVIILQSVSPVLLAGCLDVWKFKQPYWKFEVSYY